MTVSDPTPGGNNNGILDPGETATLNIVTNNSGHASIANVNGTLAITSGSSPYLTLNSTSSSLGTLAVSGTANATFNVTANASTPIGTPVDLTYSVTGGASSQYSVQAAKQVVIGLIPTYNMSTTTATTCVGNFYDPGGVTGDYSNSQDYTMTFYPGTTGNALRFIFSSFSLEANTTCSYDYLKIYDGATTSDALLGTYCGTTSPGTVTASNSSGALTFVFHSDGSVVSSGWAAAISCVSGIVTNPASFTATGYSTSQINLAWTKNASNNDVMVAWSTSSTFGTPVNGTTYSPGGTIAGGGTVLYAGNGLSYNHTSLNPNTTYYYKAFSYDGTHVYSSGLATSASTLCGTSVLPFTESFAGSALPNCWSTQISGTGAVDKWTVSATTNAGGTASEMKSTYQNINPAITRLITPAMNTLGMTQLNLSFKHFLDAYGTGCTLLVQSSTDKTNWTNEAWSVASTATNVGPATVTTTVTSNLNSATTYVAFVISGNLYQYDYWYVDDVNVTGNAATLAVTPSNQNVTSSAGTTTFTVTSSAAWTAASDQSWCTVTPSGTGNGTITATYLQNTTGSSRVANITVSASGVTPVAVTVTQAAAPTLTVLPANQVVTSSAGTATYTVTSNSSWTASSDQSWCTVTPSGSGNGTITATYTANTLLTQRIATITVTVSGLSPVAVTVTQQGIVPSLGVTPANQDVAYTAGNTTFAVTSNTSWTASSDQPWCTVTPSGSGSGTITAAYTENTTYSARVATITVSVTGLTPVTVTVTQASAPVPEFNFTIRNDIQVSDRILEFDLYLLDVQPSTPFELSIIQAGILVNNGIINGGTITPAIVPGYSELVALQQPTIVTWSTGTSNGCIKVTPKAGPGCGNGTIISTSGAGTRICRVRITNSVAFTSSSQANLTFNFTTSPYPTKVFQYSGTPCISNVLTTNTSNCFFSGNNPVLNGPPYLSVSPSDQPVPAAAGSASFTVISNATWTAVSSQPWCSVTPSGFSNGTITATYTENTDASPRVATITITVPGLTPVTATVTQAGAAIRTVNLGVFLEGLYEGEGAMHPAMDESGIHWGPGIADKIAIELHSSSNYSTVVYTASNILLNTNGTATFTIPSAYNGSYYVTVLNRNHILTTTASPVSFSPGTINLTFDSPAKAYGGNLGFMIDGIYVFYGGDSNQDMLVDGTDLSDIGNLADLAASGYIAEDINADGLIDGSDLSVAGNNAEAAIGAMTP